MSSLPEHRVLAFACWHSCVGIRVLALCVWRSLSHSGADNRKEA